MSDVSERAVDAAARRRAQTLFDRPLVLEAGAGTGKTAVLVARIVAWALHPGWERAAAERAERGGTRTDDPDRIARDVLEGVVAITFTEAAAAQMAIRTADTLRAVEQGEPPEWLDPAALPAEELRAPRARSLLRALDHLGARTIHAFCRRILAEHPLEAGVHPRFGVDADEREQRALIREVVERALPGLLEAPEDLALLMERGWGPPEVELALLDLLRAGVRAEDIADDPLAAARVEACLADLHALAAGFALRWSERLSPIGGVTQKVVEELETLASATAGPRTPDRLRSVVSTLADVSSVSGWLGRLGEWAKGGLNQRESLVLADVLAPLGAEARELRLAIQAVARLDPDLLAAAHRVICPLLADVERELRTRGVATFASLLRGARDLLVEQPSIARRLRSRMRQVLVDEFQDTDPLQCQILAELALAEPKEERPGLFLVGDPKQSIYGWRSADLAAYARFVARVVDEGGERHPLTVNFRSVPAVLAEVERVIAPVMEPVEGLQPEFQRLLVCDARAGDRGFEVGDHRPVEHWVTWAWDDERGPSLPDAENAVAIEASAVAADIGRLHREHHVSWGDVALLFRSSGDLGSYLEAFRRAGVPFVVEGDRDYYRRREVVEAAALVRCIVDPSDGLALLAVIRSAMAGVPDAALLPLWRQGLPAIAARLYGDEVEPLVELADAVARAVADLPPDVEGLDAVEGWDVNLVACLEDVAALRASFADDPADLFVETLRTRLLFEAGEASRRPGLYRIANLDRFFRDLETSLEDGEADPSAILRILRQEVAEHREAEEGRPKEAVEDAVQVMTIHKSKGLDFDHVYVVQLHKGTGHGRQNRAESSDTGCFEYQLLGAATPGYSRVERRAQAVSAVERVRTLYVALTRARERLVVVGVRDLGAKAARAASHAELLTQRSNAPVDLEQDLCDAVAAGATGFVDEDGVRWVAPGLARFADGSVLESASSHALFDQAALEDGWRTLLAARSDASARMGRPYSSAVSALAHEALRDAHRAALEPQDEEDEPRPSRDALPLSRDAAMFVGTAVHRALERLDPAADATAEQARLLSDLEDELMRSLPGEDRAAAQTRARELVEGFFAGPLFARLRELAGDVVARELPVLLPPDVGLDDGPVGFFAGAVDLVYRDAAAGALVVVDYKTDRVTAPSDLDEKAALYAGQGAGYVRAVQQALVLSEAPRFELWFLDTGDIRVI